MAKLGEWRWYVGEAEDDGEMMDCGTREDAIAEGSRWRKAGESFYIVEARMNLRHEALMGAGRIDSAPFAESRNGEWIAVRPGHPT